MEGLLRALKASPYGSFVVLVTDASAKDSNNTDTVNQIFSLIDSLNVRIFFFAGSCFGTSEYDYQIYKNIAAYSFGHVFEIYSPTPTIADLLNFFLKIPINSTSPLFAEDSDAYYYRASFLVPSNLTSFIVSASGLVNSWTFYNPSGVVENLTDFFSESWAKVSYLENPSPGIWTFEISTTSSYSIRIEGYIGSGSVGQTFNVTSFCSRCDSKASCKKDVLDYTCICEEGFNGNGFSCYDTNECDPFVAPSFCGYYSICLNTYGSYNCVCSSGFTWENKNKTCIDIDECSSPDLNNCDPNAVCNNYNGYYSCYCSTGYFGDGYRCEEDECTKDVCGFGKECIKANGSHTCSDPCLSYTTLNEPTRSTSYRDYYYYTYYYWYYGRSDYYLNGWYRFTGSGGSRLADFCPSQGSCYTRSPIWLDGSHPEPADGIVNRTVCTSSYGTCCQWTSSIQIKLCPGNFYVYKFSYPPQYYSGYCTDPSTVPNSCSCSDDEECKEVNGHYGCHCKNDGGSTDVIRPVLSCGAQEIKATFQKCDLQRFNLNTKNIHLIDSDCTGFNDFNTTNIITVVSVLKNGVCGNELVNNGTHIIFKNTIFLSLATNSSIGGEDAVSILISCVYPLDIQVSLETALHPFSNSTSVVVEGTGKLEVTIALYKDSTYTSPYGGSQVMLTSKTNLYVGVILKLGGSSQYSVQITNCYAAPSVNSTARYDIIKNGCPTKQDSSINVMQNGASVNARFSIQLFGYVRDLNSVYLYCGIHICSGTCSPTCTGARALTATDSVTTDANLILGPIIRQADPIDSTPTVGGGAYPMVPSLVLVFLLGTLLFVV
ncbi:hypothetical protein GDO81_016898 [Engystomops pustulosus]|uniref:Uromodulin n=1 Tax=Engystomops pustulosus TaxID=76066 RepID=A0AAV7A9A3_ENGPU|nr:hypothetical protein GDO81_016898 [Engystomops pustulosus]